MGNSECSTKQPQDWPIFFVEGKLRFGEGVIARSLRLGGDGVPFARCRAGLFGKLSSRFDTEVKRSHKYGKITCSGFFGE